MSVEKGPGREPSVLQHTSACALYRIGFARCFEVVVVVPTYFGVWRPAVALSSFIGSFDFLSRSGLWRMPMLTRQGQGQSWHILTLPQLMVPTGSACLLMQTEHVKDRQREGERERERAGARERRADRGKAEEGGSESGREGRRILEMVQAFEQQRGKAVEASTDFFVASVPRGPLPGSSS